MDSNSFIINPEADNSLEEIELEITNLLRKRAELVYSLGYEERYFVFNNRDGKIASDAWVLSSKSDVDSKVLFDISEKSYYVPEWNDKIKKWLALEDIKHGLAESEDIE